MFVGPFSGNFTSDGRTENAFHRFLAIFQNPLISTPVTLYHGQKKLGSKEHNIKY